MTRVSCLALGSFTGELQHNMLDKLINNADFPIEPSESASRPPSRPRNPIRQRATESRPPSTSRGPARRHTPIERQPRRPPISRVHRHPVPAPPSSVGMYTPIHPLVLTALTFPFRSSRRIPRVWQRLSRVSLAPFSFFIFNWNTNCQQYIFKVLFG